MIDFDSFKFNFALMLKAIAARNIELNCIGNTDIIEARLGSHVEYLVNYATRLTPEVNAAILRDKYYAKSILAEKGYSVMPGHVFAADNIASALNYAEHIGYPVVIKPVNGAQGDCVFPNLTDKREFIAAFAWISEKSSGCDILIEKYFAGDDYRFLVIADRDLAVVKRSAPCVTGNGISTIQQLIDRENHRRMNPRDTCLCEIYIKDEEGKRVLRHQNLTEESVLDKGQVARLRYNANVSWGGDCENVLDTVHPSYIELARSIHALFPGNHFTCVDILARDVTTPVTQDSYAFCEFNVDPGFSLHHMPGKGKPHLVLETIVDLLFPETAKTYA
jgi:cyanophycin synthetase